MTEITRSIEIDASLKEVWSYIHPQNWPTIFDFVKHVDGYSKEEPGVGTQAKVILDGEDTTELQYDVEITEFHEMDKIIYRRYGGLLTGWGMLQVKDLGAGTLVRRKSVYKDDLSDETIASLSEGIEKDNLRLKSIIEKTPN